DVIEILDDEVYEEQVTIDSLKTGLTIRGNKNAKPTIKWQDTESTFPKNVDQAQSETFSDSIMEKGKYFDQNGALRIIKARDVTIENVIVNGGGAKPFCNKGVWYNEEENEYYDLLHGNAAIVLTIASNVIIRNCEITNAYFGISVKDRNMRGAFAEPNPSDIARYNIVPLSGFGKSGNHIFENNRIHANSWGIFFESTWDMGSTIRYNLIYSNYHHGTVRSTIDGFSSSEGNNQIGGGILFKDDPISPVAIYNNTFRDNTMNIACQWQAGAYHLIFNNIFSKPHAYTNDYGIAEFSLEGIMPERYKHNLYAAQGQAPGEYDVRINNNMNKVGSGSGPIEPGSLISGGSQPANWTFPSGANNRWLEVPFKSTSASSPDFLVPDWDDPLVEEFIVDQGWPGAGIRDADETIADIGAITSGGIPETRVAIKAVNPVILNDDEATVRFNVYPINGELQDLTIKYVQWMGDLPKDPGWANEVNQGRTLNVDRPASPQSVNISHTPVMGLNSITFKVEQDEDGKYAFLEIILEGKDSDGSTVTTNVGFLPYRQLEYIFDIELYADETSSEKIKEVQVGDTVYMRVVPQRVDGKEISRGTAEDIEISLNSPFNLLGPDSTPVVISSIPFDGVTVPVVFTRIPAQGWDVISVNGIFRENTADQGRAIMGTSEQIDINPGDPAEIRFLEQSRNSEFPSIINPGENLESKLQVFDKYGNKVKKRANVSIASTEESIGAPLEPTSAESDDTGVVSFEIVVTNGGEGEVFQLVATLTYKDKDVDTDTAYLKVGKITDRFVIFYSDTNGYDPTVIIDECSSERVPVTIRAIAADTIITSRDNEFTISFDKQGLAAYSSETSTEPVTRAALVNGEAVIWIQPNIPEIKDASIEITRTDDRTILNGKRGDINFVYCDNPVESAFYFTDYGNGTVNRVELHFRDPLDEEGIPDTMIFYWPDPSVERIVTSGMTIDSEDPSIMTIILAQPFDSLITARGSSPDLGVCVRVNEEIGSVNRQTFEIEEKIGPLLMSAIVVERLTEEGNDTLFLTFSEFVNYENLEGNSLILIKGETTVTLNIL
ncbi:MAG TPA: right-handed parallel beta-helix repeat-containing protein, partial [Chitinispirillaceae bacterium]|nr:right-handed parallel beta-helix repeat-containing protein [Chitinispirillaceae bacterium]